MPHDTPKNGLEADSTQELGRRLRAGDLGAMGPLMELYGPRIRRLLSIRLGVDLRDLLHDGELFDGLERRVQGRLERLDPEEPAAVLRWLTSLAEALLRERIGMVTSRTLTLSRPLTQRPQGSPDRRAALQDLLDNQVQKLAPSEREVVLARDYLKGDWECVRRWLHLKSVAEARTLYRGAQAHIRARLHRRLGRKSG